MKARRQRASPYLWNKPGDEELAKRALAKLCQALKERKPFQDAGGAVTVRSFAKKWLESRPGTSPADDGPARDVPGRRWPAAARPRVSGDR